jgi:hypothetical protein
VTKKDADAAGRIPHPAPRTPPGASRTPHTATTAQVLEAVPEQTLDVLLRHGIIPPSVLKSRDIFYYYDSLVRVSKLNPALAARETADKFDVSVRKVYRAVRMMGE